MNTCTSVSDPVVPHQIVLLRHATSSWNETVNLFIINILQVNVNLKFKGSLNRSIEHKCIICGIDFDSLDVTLKARRHQSIEANSFGQKSVPQLLPVCPISLTSPKYFSMMLCAVWYTRSLAWFCSISMRSSPPSSSTSRLSFSVSPNFCAAWKVVFKICQHLHQLKGKTSFLTIKMLLMASSMTRMTLVSLTCSRLMIASKAPLCTRVTTCSTVPPLVKLVTAHTASL